VSSCCGGGIPSCEHVFDERTADDDLRRYRTSGPSWATRALIDELADGLEVTDLSVVDIGAGVGAVHIGLLERGARTAVDIDGSSAYLAAARDEANRRGLDDRTTHILGDATRVAGDVEPADLVALDRVVCCYADAPALLGAAATLATRRLGFVYPRDTWWVRIGVTIANPILFRRSAGYRMRVHRPSVFVEVLRSAGFRRRRIRDGRVWRVEIWERAAPAA
jgi:magnesium-protoporphyrin O-methyltransferase